MPPRDYMYMCRDLCHSDLHVPVDLHITNQQRMPLDLHMYWYTYFIGQSVATSLRTNIESRPLRRQKEGQGRTPPPSSIKSHLQIVCCADQIRARTPRTCAPLLTLSSDSKAYQPNHITGERRNFQVYFQLEFHEFEGACSE